MNSRNANYGLKTTGNQSLENSCFSVFFRRTTPVKMGAQGRIKGGYSIHTPYIVLVSVIVTITLSLKNRVFKSDKMGNKKS